MNQYQIKMSFLSILKTGALDVGKALFLAAGVGQQIGPEVTAINPAAGAALSLISGTVILVEGLISRPGKGGVRKQVASQIVAENAPTADTAVVSKGIDDMVTTLNTLEKLAKENPAAFQQLIAAFGVTKFQGSVVQ